jgi:hypothetical protein
MGVQDQDRGPRLPRSLSHLLRLFTEYNTTKLKDREEPTAARGRNDQGVRRLLENYRNDPESIEHRVASGKRRKNRVRNGFRRRMGVVADSSRNRLSTRSVWRATGGSPSATGYRPTRQTRGLYKGRFTW